MLTIWQQTGDPASGWRGALETVNRERKHFDSMQQLRQLLVAHGWTESVDADSGSGPEER